jgi:hypothetical protein
MRKDKIVYSICIGDIQEVAQDELNRKLTEEELKKAIDKMGDYITWYDSISYTFDALGLKEAEETEEE